MVAAKDIFLRALGLRAIDRPAFLDSACRGNPELRGEVEELFAYHGESGDLFDSLGIEGPLGDRGGPPPKELGPYVVDGFLGLGATGVVYKAQRALDEPEASFGPVVALKILRVGSAWGEHPHRFRREAEALRKLDHAGIARLVDAGVFETAGGPLPYVATEYVAGVSLRNWAAESPRTTADVVAVLRQLTAALASAHAAGVIHRDLKPENIIVTPEGTAKILDFGMARLVDPESSGLSLMTRVGQIVGTIPYMSPEQALAGPEPVDARTDLYSLGVMAYELLAGRLPFEVPTDSLHRAVMAVVTAEPRPLGEVDPRLKGDIEYLVGRLMERRPADRYESATALLSDLDRLAAARPLERVRRTASIGSRRTVWLSLAGVVLLVVGVVSFPELLRRRTHAVNLPANRAVVAASMRHIGQATNLLHLGDRTEATIRTAIAHLDTADARLQSLPGNLPLSDVYRYLYWRRGEGHYFLGALLSSKEEFWRARTDWALAWDQWLRPFDPSAVDSTMENYSGLVGNADNTGAGGMILVHMSLAGYETPLTHFRNAEHFAEEGWGSVAAIGDTINDPAANQKERELMHGWCMTLNNRGMIRARIGYLVGNAATIESGLAYLRLADRRWPDIRIADPRGANLHNLGRALRYRGIVTGRPADFDSADAALRQALAYRDAGHSPSAYAATQFERARTVLDRGDATPGDLARSLSQVQLARRVLEPLASRLEMAEGQVIEADLLVALALRNRRTDGLDRADSLLTATDATLAVGRYPLQNVLALEVRSRLLQVRGQTGGGAKAGLEALACLDRALELTSPVEEPFHYGRLRRQREALSASMDPARGGARRGQTPTGS